VLFVGRIPPRELAQLFSLSDLHLYLTVPFVLLWSLMDALACGCTILASDTAPVREMIRHEENGLLVDFFDVDGFVAAANRVLDDPAAFRQLGRTGVQLIEEQYSLETCMPRMRAFFQEVSAAGGRVD
jgi:glycosyltransferase involved in cell wall biosynthesis